MQVGLGGAITVTATERWFSEVRAGRAFGGAIIQANIAAEFSHVQLFNPVASGVTALVRAIVGSTNTSDRMEVAFFNTALATLGADGRNLLSGGAAPVAQVRAGTNAAQQGDRFAAQQILANTPIALTEEWVCELGPAEGVIIRLSTVNISLVGSFSWVEL